MSSSERATRGSVLRGAVLAPEALAAFGIDAPWRPLEIATYAPETLDEGIPAPDGFALLHLADRFVPPAAPTALPAPSAPATGRPSIASWQEEEEAGGFAAALPDLTAWSTDVSPDAAGDAIAAAIEERAWAREQQLRAELEQAHAERLAAEAARHEAELQQAYEAGRAAGQAEGEAAAEAAVGAAVSTLLGAAEQLAAQEERWLANLQENVAVLAVGVARHVIGREVAADDALVLARVSEALAEFPTNHPVSVRVHPADLALVKRALDGDVSRPLRWTPDERVERGGCLIEGRERIVDGRVDAALERVYRQLSGQHA